MHYLVKLRKNYADEFDVYGFAVLTEEEWVTFQQQVRDDFSYSEHYFGTNEYLEWDSAEQYLKSLEVKEIDEIAYAVLINLFGQEYGKFIVPTGSAYDEEE
jgi:hypothetical protein